MSELNVIKKMGAKGVQSATIECIGKNSKKSSNPSKDLQPKAHVDPKGTTTRPLTMSELGIVTKSSRFAMETDLTQNRQGRSYMCPICSKTFDKKISLTTHGKFEHRAEKIQSVSVRCPHAETGPKACFFVSSNPKLMSAHLSSKHGNQKIKC